MSIMKTIVFTALSSNPKQGEESIEGDVLFIQKMGASVYDVKEAEFIDRNHLPFLTDDQGQGTFVVQDKKIIQVAQRPVTPNDILLMVMNGLINDADVVEMKQMNKVTESQGKGSIINKVIFDVYDTVREDDENDEGNAY